MDHVRIQNEENRAIVERDAQGRDMVLLTALHRIELLLCALALHLEIPDPCR